VVQKAVYFQNISWFYDSIFQQEYPAVSALKQTAKLFEGAAGKLASQIYPKYGEKPGLFLSCAASYNAPGIATVVVARRFPIPEESEVTALVPWNGETEMIIERGFLPDHSPYNGFASKMEREKKIVSVKNNVFRFSTVFPELTVIRLIRKGAENLPEKDAPSRSSYSPQFVFDHTSIKRDLPRETKQMKKHQLRQAGGFSAVFGQNANCSKIPATVPEDKFNRVSPVEKESICVNFKIHATNPKRFDSVYLPFGNVSGSPVFLTFNIFARASGLKKRDRMSRVTLRFAVCGKLYSTSVNMEQWEKIVVPLNGINPAWQHLRILEPTGIFSKRLQTVSFEINDVSVYSK